MKTERLTQIESSAMKNVFVIVLLLMSLRPAVALYWDANGNAPGAGGSTPTGTWGVNAYWSADADGTAATQAWVSTNTAVFCAGTDATGTFTVNVSGTQTAVSLIFQEGNVTLAGGSLILSGAGGPVDVYPATVTINSVLAGSTGLTKGSLGTLILSGANHYAGDTAVHEGVLQLGASGVIPSNSRLVLTNISAARATFATGGFSQSLGPLSVQGVDSTLQRVIDFGNGASALAFANSSAEDWNGMPLLIVNYTLGVDTLRVGTSSSGLTPTQLALLRFTDLADATAQIDAQGFITPVLPSGARVQLTWAAADNRSYRVQYKDHLEDANWTNLVPDVLALGPTASTIQTSVTAAKRFYRVVLLPLP
jgi:autotransporter-associated beta strand protein